MADVPLLGQASANEREATTDTPTLLEVDIAFVVFVHRDENGVMHAFATPDLNAPLVPANVPSADDIIAAMAVVTSDILAEKTARQTVGVMNAHAQQAMKAQENARVQQLLASPKGMHQ